MVLLRSVFATNYKAYKKIIVPIAKLNVYIGKNSAGKSSLIRLVPFILNSLNLKDRGVIDFSPFGIDIGATYSDIVHGHSDYTQMGLGALFDIGDDTVSFLTRITYSTELKEVIVSQFIGVLNGEDVVKMELDLDSTGKNKKPVYKQDNKTRFIEFNGLIPNLSSDDYIDNDKAKKLIYLLNFIKSYDFKISYLGPFRSELLRTYTKKTLQNPNIGHKGQNAPYLFQMKEDKSNGLLGSKIKSWMSSNFDGKYFSMRQFDSAFSITCVSKTSTSNITDEGMGFAQLFPSIINRNIRDIDEVKGIEIIEQPELHMHPAACGVVADLYISAMKNNLVFIETHSKEFILRIRRRIAEGLESSNVYLGYITADNEKLETELEDIIIDKNGGVEGWPSGIFEEDFDEVMALHKANNKNENNL